MPPPEEPAANGSALLDPFDLPEWLVGQDVVWRALESVADKPVVKGRLHAVDGEEPPLRLDLVAVDAAWPVAQCSPADRREAHQAWHFGQVVLLDHEGVTALGVPTAAFNADLALEALRRFAKAVGSDPWRYAVHLPL
jgi:hypothetical protein